MSMRELLIFSNLIGLISRLVMIESSPSVIGVALLKTRLFGVRRHQQNTGGRYSLCSWRELISLSNAMPAAASGLISSDRSIDTSPEIRDDRELLIIL